MAACAGVRGAVVAAAGVAAFAGAFAAVAGHGEFQRLLLLLFLLIYDEKENYRGL